MPFVRNDFPTKLLLCLVINLNKELRISVVLQWKSFCFYWPLSSHLPQVELQPRKQGCVDPNGLERYSIDPCTPTRALLKGTDLFSPLSVSMVLSFSFLAMDFLYVCRLPRDMRFFFFSLFFNPVLFLGLLYIYALSNHLWNGHLFIYSVLPLHILFLIHLFKTKFI